MGDFAATLDGHLDVLFDAFLCAKQHEAKEKVERMGALGCPSCVTDHFVKVYSELYPQRMVEISRILKAQILHQLEQELCFDSYESFPIIPTKIDFNRSSQDLDDNRKLRLLDFYQNDLRTDEENENDELLNCIISFCNSIS